MMPLLLSVLKISTLVYAGFGAYLFFAQRSFMYFPVAEVEAADLPVEYLDSDGHRLKLWRVGPVRESALIYFGGNAENVYFNAADFQRTLPQHTVYLVNYRGYGGSGGEPSQSALFTDALNVFDHLSPRHTSVSVLGRSLGSGVAVYLASQRPVDRLALATPHDSALAIAQSMYPVYPVSLMLKDRYESVRYAPGVEAPTMMLIAALDTIIPPRHSLALAEAFDDDLVTRVTIPGAGHNGLSGFDQYWQEIGNFMQP